MRHAQAPVSRAIHRNRFAHIPVRRRRTELNALFSIGIAIDTAVKSLMIPDGTSEIFFISAIEKASMVSHRYPVTGNPGRAMAIQPSSTLTLCSSR